LDRAVAPDGRPVEALAVPVTMIEPITRDRIVIRATAVHLGLVMDELPLDEPGWY
jgi:hypothetical protein